MRTNYLQNVWLCHYGLPYLIASKGRINALSSGVGIMDVPLRIGYCGAKFALEGFYQAFRYEISDYGIVITITRPGPTFTNALVNALGPDGVPGHPTFTWDMKAPGVMPASQCVSLMFDATQRGDTACNTDKWLRTKAKIIGIYPPLAQWYFKRLFTSGGKHEYSSAEKHEKDCDIPYNASLLSPLVFYTIKSVSLLF